ncbi:MULTISPECIES: methionine--tRNA ligase [unclassified Lactococcus]|uniref:methionine--tRNA ligase n=1 Tax=unclassified Lactococcus TaxID=2643510 RepID=UPI0011C9FBFB|nr:MULTISPECIES: methionine--tRNA ligase [unclassified Lactococcus]MQW22298.1 methionine--tRNA ligase [Lactococcus sp. dk101]TXK45227.1 methionine--tRNA ligase [Lactococcus sp. dk310]TXK50995.1 methionine--tRNA ligase [Lactococcus sp. dk322]
MTEEQSKKTFYITTPIYYPSGKLHLGSTYTTIACDVLARYKRLMGYDTFYLTGLDEHGQKIQQRAEAAGMEPKAYLDPMAEDVKKLWQLLDISYDKFIRTTDTYHEEAVQKIFEKLLEQGDIYLGKYEGWYSVSDEEFFTESQLEEVYRDNDGNVIGGMAPSGHEVEKVEEESYFFRMSKYADWLLKYYEEHPNFIQPEIRKNEMINTFIKPGLEDLAVSRTTFTWGIPIKSNPKHVIYVWLDALFNYVTALGYGSSDDSMYKKFWPGVNMVGKDILRFHTIYWPIFLHALGMETPTQVFGHGWYQVNGRKMSKSFGNVIYAEPLVARYGLDPYRYYILRAMPFGNDGNFTAESYIDRINFDLANDLGNLLNRTVAMINKYNGGVIEKTDVSTEFDGDLLVVVEKSMANYHAAMDKFEFSVALSEVWNIISRTNKYIDETAPWVLAKLDSDKPKLNNVLYHLAENLRLVASLLQPFMHGTSEQIFAQLGLTETRFDLENLTFGYSFTNPVVAKGEPIFPRLDREEEIAVITNEMLGGGEKPAEKELVLNKKQIEFDDFDKVEIRVAQVVAVERVEGSDKLLKFELEAGDKGTRTILSGIAKFYPNEQELVGQKLQIVANLKPRKMMKKYVSEGMILSAEFDGKLSVLTVDESVPNGSVIG